MPVIVDEVVITVELTQAQPRSLTSPVLTPEERQALVRECAERVLDILERREER